MATIDREECASYYCRAMGWSWERGPHQGDYGPDCRKVTVRYVPEAEVERYRVALARIADAKSGVWGQIAHDALHAHPTDRGI